MKFDFLAEEAQDSLKEASHVPYFSRQGDPGDIEESFDVRSARETAIPKEEVD